jgi:phosphoenolpyruvate carboxykinase (ATP)
MITAALEGKLDGVEFTKDPVFGIEVPKSCPNVPSEVLSPRNTWAHKEAYDNKANELADAFNANFKKFADQASAEILAAAPKATEKA